MRALFNQYVPFGGGASMQCCRGRDFPGREIICITQGVVLVGQRVNLVVRHALFLQRLAQPLHDVIHVVHWLLLLNGTFLVGVLDYLPHSVQCCRA